MKLVEGSVKSQIEAAINAYESLPSWLKNKNKDKL